MTNEVKSLQQQLKALQEKYSEIEAANEKLKQRLAQIDALYSITSTLSVIINFSELTEFVKSTFTKTFKMDQFSLMLLETDSNSLSIKCFHGLPMESTKPNSSLKSQTIFRQAVESKKSIYIQNTSERKGNLDQSAGIVKGTGSFLCLPIICDDEVLGVLNLYRRDINAFDSVEIELFNKISEQLAFTLKNILLFEHTKELSITDELTGIYNRRYFNQRFERELQRSKRYHHSLSVLMLDIDHFKLYNDVNGHIKGDEVLKKVALILESNLRKADILARFGGEEFVILLPEISKSQARKVADKLRQKIEKASFENEESLPEGKITVSIGLAVYSEDSKEPQKLIQYADKALYTAKTRGRNCVVWHGMDISSVTNLGRNKHNKELVQSS
jgi:diguanylate cyclase (GGDEF)-like protein